MKAPIEVLYVLFAYVKETNRGIDTKYGYLYLRKVSKLKTFTRKKRLIEPLNSKLFCVFIELLYI